MWRYANPNPAGNKVGDCTVRALSLATGTSWDEMYDRQCRKGASMHDMPSSNAVWGAVLRDEGFHREVIPAALCDCYTVEDFARDHPWGRYVLAISGHVVACIDGDIYDTWDSSRELPVFYWTEGS